MATFLGYEWGPRVDTPPLRYEITQYQADMHARYERMGFVERQVRKAMSPESAARVRQMRDVWAYVENIKYDAGRNGGQVVVPPSYR